MGGDGTPLPRRPLWPSWRSPAPPIAAGGDGGATDQGGGDHAPIPAVARPPPYLDSCLRIRSMVSSDSPAVGHRLAAEEARSMYTVIISSTLMVLAISASSPPSSPR